MDNQPQVIERGDIVYSGKLPSNGLVMLLYPTYAVVQLGEHVDKGEAGVFHQWWTVELRDLQVVRKHGAAQS